jgi:hypothetical protein
LIQVAEKLGLSYTNIAGLHKNVDNLRARAGEWKVRKLHFKDHPDEEFTFHHRNIIDAIKSLWGDPALASHLIYRPRKVFKDAFKSKRMYSEMWDGKWWNTIQVSNHPWSIHQL